MSIARIGEFEANPQLIEELHRFLLSIMPMIQNSQGCESVQLFQRQEEPARFTMIEIWESIDWHQASVRNIPPEKLAEIRPLLASAPSGGYFRILELK